MSLFTTILQLFLLHLHHSPFLKHHLPLTYSSYATTIHLFPLHPQSLICSSFNSTSCSAFTNSPFSAPLTPATISKFNCSFYSSAPIPRTNHFCPLYLNSVSWSCPFNATKDDCIFEVRRRLHSCIDPITRRMVHINQYPCKHSCGLAVDCRVHMATACQRFFHSLLCKLTENRRGLGFVYFAFHCSCWVDSLLAAV
jgi:hypothetical protein